MKLKLRDSKTGGDLLLFKDEKDFDRLYYSRDHSNKYFTIAWNTGEKQLVTINGRTSRRLEEGEQYYLYQKGEMILLPDNKNLLAEKFPDKKDQMAQFISSQQLKMHTPNDFVQVVMKYNELIP